MNKNDRHIKGFTLLEVLVGTLILSILLTTLYSFWNAFMKSGSQVIEEVTDNEGMQNAFNRMSTDLEQLFIVQPPRFKKKGSEFDPDDPYRFLGKETNKSAGTFPYLSFASLAHLKTGIDSRPGVARIVYYVKSDKNNLLNLYRADNLEPFPEEETACEDPVLFKNISAMNIRYLDSNGDEFRYWDSDSEEFFYTFPSKVVLEIFFEKNGNKKKISTSIPIYAHRNPGE